MDSPTVCCAAPAVIFSGQYVFRTRNGTMSVILPLSSSAIFAALAVFCWKTGDELLVAIVSMGFALGALSFGALGVSTLWSWANNRRVRVEINEDGIIFGNRFWKWGEVRSFAGTRYDNGVCLEFKPRTSVVWGGDKLPTTPLLTDEQYVELARKLGECVSSRFLHVVVSSWPKNPPVAS